MLDRRTVLQGGVQICGLAALGSGGFIVASYLTPIPEGLGDEDVEIADADLKPGRAVQVLHKGKPVLVVRDADGGLHALSAVCTHLGCLVKWDADQQRILCPCHDAAFTLQGEVLGGPAPEPLPRVPIGVVDGMIRLEAESG